MSSSVVPLTASARKHVHEHGHEHAHGHDHAHELVPARAAKSAFSLLTLSLGQRLAGAAVLSAILWLAVWWALI